MALVASSEDPERAPQEEWALKGCLMIPADSKMEAESALAALRCDSEWFKEVLLTWARTLAFGCLVLPFWTRSHRAAGKGHNSGVPGVLV